AGTDRRRGTGRSHPGVSPCVHPGVPHRGNAPEARDTEIPLSPTPSAHSRCTGSSRIPGLPRPREPPGHRDTGRTGTPQISSAPRLRHPPGDPPRPPGAPGPSRNVWIPECLEPSELPGTPGTTGTTGDVPVGRTERRHGGAGVSAGHGIAPGLLLPTGPGRGGTRAAAGPGTGPAGTGGCRRLLPACSRPEQALETTKTLVLCDARVVRGRGELQRRQEARLRGARRPSDGGPGAERVPCRGTVCISDLRIPLMWKDNPSTSGIKGSCTAVPCSCCCRWGPKIHDTPRCWWTGPFTDICFEGAVLL
uniref:Anillin homology domain-containing protein n=1 Tax=Taeniopygia guttata TaxID=59729 RepID=A0A674GCZ9_TAEGU